MATQYRPYLIKNGDTLRLIAYRYLGDVEQFRIICDLNNLSPIDAPPIGQQIYIPITTLSSPGRYLLA